MILAQVVFNNKIKMATKEKIAFGKAVKQYYPNITNLYVNHADDYFWTKFSQLDLPEKDCVELLQLTSKYLKLWIYS